MKRLPLVLAVVYGTVCTSGVAQKTSSVPENIIPGDPAADAAAMARRASGTGMCRVHFDGDGRVSYAVMTRSTGSMVLDEDTTRSARQNWRGLPSTTMSVPVKYSTVPLDKSNTIRYTTPIPEYPFWASRYHVSGTCLLQALFDAQGGPVYINVLRSCGNKQLDDFTARYASKHWKSTGGEESMLTFPVTYLYHEPAIQY